MAQWEGTPEEFMQLMRGIPARTVARFFMKLTSGIDFRGCSKALMADDWVGKHGFSDIAHRRDALASIVERYRDGMRLSDQLSDVITQLSTALQNAKEARASVVHATENGNPVHSQTVVQNLEHVYGNAELVTSTARRLAAEWTPATPLDPQNRPTDIDDEAENEDGWAP